MPRAVRLLDERGNLDPALQRVSAEAAQRSGRGQSRRARSAEKRASLSTGGGTREATTIARRLAAAYPDTNKQFNTGQVQPLLDARACCGAGPRHAVDDGICVLRVGVLLIACVNVMNMQFARGRCARRSSRSARCSAHASSAGARRLTENRLLASLGAAAGILLAYY